MKSFFKYAGKDIPASIVVFLVALPLCLGIALGSGAPLFSGLIAGIVGGIVVGSLSKSHVSVTGPAAGLTAIVASAIASLPSYEAFLLTVVFAGFFQLAMGYLKAGVIADYVPASVIKGMLAAIGVILIFKQIPHLIGYDVDFEGDYSFQQKQGGNTFQAIAEAMQKITPLACIIGFVSLAIQIIWDKILVKKISFLKLVPAPLIVVIAGTLLAYIFSQNNRFSLQANQMVNIPAASNINEFLSFFTLPDFSFITLPSIYLSALTIAIVASLETLLNIEAADELDPYNRVTPTNHELKAQGIGNIVSGLLGGLPVTSVVVRTSANINAGAATKFSAILHGLLLLLCVAFIPFILNLIPLSCLAAILIYTGYKLASPAIFQQQWKKGLDQFLPFVITILVIVFTDLLIGVIIGIGVGLFFVMRSNFKSALLVINDNHKYLFRLRKDVSFLNKPLLKRKLEEVPSHSSVLIDISRADFIDKDVADVINHFIKHAPLKNIQVNIKRNAYKPSHQLIHVKANIAKPAY